MPCELIEREAHVLQCCGWLFAGAGQLHRPGTQRRADRHHGSCHGAATGRGRWRTPDPALCGPDALKSALRMQGLAISSAFSGS
ncbi:hypothetical protein [Streptomyces sp. NPDC056323]|uniref:hypothetical protein n=1 Tax=unclassified Streptomyces TaxID=2593676 RepID=UPI0035E02491